MTVSNVATEGDQSPGRARANSIIYYIVRSDRPGEVKIGLTTNVIQRAKSLREGRENKVTLLAVEPGDRKVERMTHAMFSAMRLGGEWFTLSAAIISHIMELDQVPVLIEGDDYFMPAEYVES